MKNFCYILAFFLLISLFSCTDDIMDTEALRKKELLMKKFSTKDSLELLTINNVDFGSVKLRTVNSQYVSIINNSPDKTVIIYDIKTKDQSGLFTYSYSLPLSIAPGEDIAATGKIKVKFVADDYHLDFHYDTLFINNSSIALHVMVKVRY